MQDDIKNTNQPDAFSEIFRLKLENYQLPVDENGWDEIEARMRPRRKKRGWFWISIISAAVLALLFTLRPLVESSINIAKQQQNSFQIIEKVPYQKDKRYSDIEKIVDKKKDKLTVTKHQVDIGQQEFSADKYIADKHSVTISDSAETKSRASEFANIKVSKKETIGQAIVENKREVSVTKSIDNSSANSLENAIYESVSKPLNNNKWLLAAGFGSGGANSNSLLGNSEMLSDKGPVSLVNATTYNTILTPNDFTNIVHSPPVSFGLVVRKQLDKVWSLESGLVYTYLLSTYVNQGVQLSNAKLHLHYVGVPMNLVARVWNNQKWDVYLASGVMVEKGLRSNYIQNQYFGNQVYTTAVQQGIDGLQWSLNVSMGATYKFQKRLGIYFEPKWSYFLENNQPMSARTVQPVVIGFIAGLRFEL